MTQKINFISFSFIFHYEHLAFTFIRGRNVFMILSLAFYFNTYFLFLAHPPAACNFLTWLITFRTYFSIFHFLPFRP